MNRRYRNWDRGECWCTACAAIVASGATGIHDDFHIVAGTAGHPDPTEPLPAWEVELLNGQLVDGLTLERDRARDTAACLEAELAHTKTRIAALRVDIMADHLTPDGVIDRLFTIEVTL